MFNNLTTAKDLSFAPVPKMWLPASVPRYIWRYAYNRYQRDTMNLISPSAPGSEAGEIYMKMLEFYDIDFDCPLARNYGDNVAGLGALPATTLSTCTRTEWHSSGTVCDQKLHL